MDRAALRVPACRGSSALLSQPKVNGKRESPSQAFCRHASHVPLHSSFSLQASIPGGTPNLCLIITQGKLTWQRGLSAATRSCCSAVRELLIQGGVWRHRPSRTFVNMETKEDNPKAVPAFDGKLDNYRDYRKRALIYFNSLEDHKQSLAAPRLIASLGGSAFECLRERDPADFRNQRGVMQLLAVLDERFQFSPEQELSDKLEDLFFRLRRRRGEETTSFTTRFETMLAKTEELITDEHRQERRRQTEAQRAEYRRTSLDFVVARRPGSATRPRLRP